MGRQSSNAHEVADLSAACFAGLKTDDLKEPPLPGIQAAWAGTSPVKVPLLKLQGAIPSHMLDTNDSWNAAPSVEVVSSFALS